MTFIDVHAHLDHFKFKDDLDNVIYRAKKADVKTIITNGINPETNRIALEIAGKYGIVKASLGIYPPDSLQKEIDKNIYPLKPNVFDVDEEIGFIKKNKDNIAAVGEIGLDYENVKDKGNQQQIFKNMIELAEQLKKPVIVHSRKAENDVIDILESSNCKKVVLHCFCGKQGIVKKAADLGYYFSIPTNIVRAQNFQLMVKEVDINQLFCETDAPYLSPYPGKRNEPAFVVESYKKIAEIKKISIEEVKEKISKNFLLLFQ